VVPEAVDHPRVIKRDARVREASRKIPGYRSKTSPARRASWVMPAMATTE
jgi:hypothetical protein